jgi:hypothetical protein
MPASPVISQSIPVSSFASRTAVSPLRPGANWATDREFRGQVVEERADLLSP